MKPVGQAFAGAKTDFKNWVNNPNSGKVAGAIKAGVNKAKTYYNSAHDSLKSMTTASLSAANKLRPKVTPQDTSKTAYKSTSSTPNNYSAHEDKWAKIRKDVNDYKAGFADRQKNRKLTNPSGEAVSDLLKYKGLKQGSFA